MILPLNPQFLRDFLQNILSHKLPYPARFRMSALMFTDLRRLGRDEIDLVLFAPVLLTGFWATWAGVGIWVSKTVPQAVVLAEDYPGKVIAHESVGCPFHPGSLADCAHPKCVDLRLDYQAREVLET